MADLIPNLIPNSNAENIYIYSFSSNQIIQFKSFITDFSDNFTSKWNSQEIYGRMDAISTFQNTTRKITLAFDVPSESLEDAVKNSRNADILINSLYPVYEEQNNIKGAATLSSPPLFRIKLSNLITNPYFFQENILMNIGTSYPASNNVLALAGLLGYIDSFSFKPDLESGFIRGVGNASTDSEINFRLYPKLYKVNFNFNIIHEQPLGNKVESGKHIQRDRKQDYNPSVHGYNTAYNPAENKKQIESSDNEQLKTNNIITSIAGEINNFLGK